MVLSFVRTLYIETDKELRSYGGMKQQKAKMKELIEMVEEKNWISNCAKMVAHFEAYPTAKQATVVNALMEMGNETPDLQTQAWGSITQACRGMPNSPISRGRQADLPSEIDIGLDKALVPYQTASLTFYENSIATCGDYVTWGRGGNDLGDAAAYAEHETQTKRNALIRAYRAFTQDGGPKESDRVIWDGSFNKKGQITGVTLNPKVTEDEVAA